MQLAIFRAQPKCATHQPGLLLSERSNLDFWFTGPQTHNSLLTMAPNTSSPVGRPYHTPGHDSDLDDPFYSLLLSDSDTPKYRDCSQNSKYYYRRWEGLTSQFDLEDFARLLQGQFSDCKEGVVIIEDIDKKAISALGKAIPDIDLYFLHQHATRLETPQIGLTEYFHMEQLTPYAKTSKPPYGSHFDGCCTLDSSPNIVKGELRLALSFACISESSNRDYRTETFVRHDGTWYRASTRISCCMLRPGLCELPFA
jgi:hypothetical protein